MKNTISLLLLFLSLQSLSQCLLTSSITPGNSISICAGSSLCIPPQSGSNYQWMQNPVWNDLGNSLFSSGQTIGNIIALDPFDVPYVAYKDQANAGKCTVHKLSGNTWINVGPPAFTPGVVNFLSMAIDNLGTPYIAFLDGSLPSPKLSVMKFNGANWVFVGPQGFNPGIGTAWYNHIAFDAAGTPYVAFMDGSSALGGISVMKFNGSNWVLVGPQGFSAGQANNTRIAFDAAGTTPYVVYIDGANSNKLTAMKFNGSSWVGVGPAGFTAPSNSHAIAFDKSGLLNVCFQDGSASGWTSVMKFNGSNWVYVGTPGFNSCCGGSTQHCIAFDAANTPYVAFGFGSGSALVSWRYNGSAWTEVGAFSSIVTSSASSVGDHIGLVVNKAGIPYVGFSQNLSGAKAMVRKFDGTNIGTNSTCLSPTVASTYIANINQSCGGSLALNIVTITAINPLPTINASSNSSLLCIGQSASLTVSGASTYTWSTGSNSTSIVISPTITNTYSVSGTNSNGCINLSTITQSVSSCLNIISFQENNVKIYPNPFCNYLSFEAQIPAKIIILNVLGETVLRQDIEGNEHVQTETFLAGIYLLVIEVGNQKKSFKLIKEN